MAPYPCQFCNNPYPGESRNVYLNLYRGQDKASFRFIVCEQCEEALVQDWVPRAMRMSEAGDWTLPPPNAEEVGPGWIPATNGNGPKSTWRPRMQPR